MSDDRAVAAFGIMAFIAAALVIAVETFSSFSNDAMEPRDPGSWVFIGVAEGLIVGVFIGLLPGLALGAIYVALRRRIKAPAKT